MGWFSAVIERRTARAWMLGAILLSAALATAAALVVTGVAAAATCATATVLSGSAFEIDSTLPPGANLVVNGVAADCDDWVAPGAGSVTTAQQDDPSGGDDDAFGQGTAEDDANPTIVAGSVPPNKSDLKVFGTNTEIGTNGKFLELFWTRVNSPQGTTNMDFELNKLFCNPAATPTNCADNGDGVTAETPLRSVGDKLITYDLSKGGTVPTISIRTWNGSAWGGPTSLSGTSNPLAVGSVNNASVAGATIEGVNLGTSLDPFTFGEAAISYSALFSGQGCGTFGSAYLKSRSSDSFKSEIKDFIKPEPVTISNCATLTTQATNTTPGGTITDTATLSPSNATGDVTFKLFGPDATPDDPTCTTPIYTETVTVANGKATTTPYPPQGTTLQAGTYFWTAKYNGDSANAATAESACGESGETSVVSKVDSTISTVQDVIPNDTATVPSDATGDVTFTLYDKGDATCEGPSIYTETANVDDATNSASTNNLGGNTNDARTITDSGTYNWVVTYNGDAKYNSSTSACGVEAVTIKNT